MKLDGSSELTGADEKTLEVRAAKMLAEHGRLAMQCVVDEMQHALRLGDEKKAAQRERLLRVVERKFYAR